MAGCGGGNLWWPQYTTVRGTRGYLKFGLSSCAEAIMSEMGCYRRPRAVHLSIVTHSAANVMLPFGRHPK